MSSLAVYDQGGLNATPFSAFAGETEEQTLYSIPAPQNDDKLKQMINDYQLLQFGDIIKAARIDTEYIKGEDGNVLGNPYTLENIVSYAHEANDGSLPIIIEITGFTWQNGQYYRNIGHSVVAFGCEDTEGIHKIKVYDPNYPDQTRYISIDTDKGTWLYDTVRTSEGALLNWGSTGSITPPGGSPQTIHCSIRYIDAADFYDQIGSNNLQGLPGKTTITLPYDSTVVILESGSGGLSVNKNPDITDLSGTDIGAQPGGLDNVIMGAIQNRLEYAIENLTISSENISAAENRIPNFDAHKDMANFAKNNILIQSTIATFAQLNQQPQKVLSLLRFAPDGITGNPPFTSYMTDEGMFTIFKADGSELDDNFEVNIVGDKSSITVWSDDPAAVISTDSTNGGLSLYSEAGKSFKYNFTDLAESGSSVTEVTGLLSGTVSILPAGDTALIYGDGVSDVLVTKDGEPAQSEVLSAELLAEYSFSDVNPDDWFYNDVYAAVGTGAMSGYGDGRFGPTDKMTVADFIFAVCRAAGLGENIDAAVTAGIVSETDGFFGRWDYEILREEAARIALNTVRLFIDEPEIIIESLSVPDIDGANSDYIDNIRTSYQIGLIEGIDTEGLFQPKRALTRAEAASIILRIFAHKQSK